MRYADIIRTINGILKSKYPTITRYGRDTVDKAVPPYFFVSCTPSGEEHESRNNLRKACTIRITYVQKVPDQADNLEKIDTIHDALGVSLEIPSAGRYLHVYDYSCDYVGGSNNILQINFVLRWLDSTQGDFDGSKLAGGSDSSGGTGEGYGMMEYVDINMEDKNGKT